MGGLTLTSADRARIAISLLTEPGDERAGQQLTAAGAEATVDMLVARRRRPLGPSELEAAVTAQARRADAIGARLVTPEGQDWPSQLDDLGDRAPFLLWVRGTGSLRSLLLRSVSIVGARACSHYGRSQAEMLAAELALLGWTVVSGGAFGIDAAAHRGALAVTGITVLVTAGGVDRPYPRAHEDLYGRIIETGAVISELPLGTAAARHRFLTRNRLVAALSRGTVIVEAARRSGTSATASAAEELRRHVMALPGPVTSDLSAGCHDLLRDGRAVLVTGCPDVVELIGAFGGDPPVDQGTTAVLQALLRCDAAEESELAAALGCSEATVAVTLAGLEGAGFAVRGRRGWTVSDAALARIAGTD